MADGTPIGALAVRIGADANELVSELKRADTALGKTAAKFAEGVASAAKFAVAAAGAGAAVFALVNRVADSADELGKMSQKVGVSVEALSALKYAAELSDVSLEQLGTGLKQLSKFMVENKIQGVSVEEQLLKIADEFAGASDGATKTAVAMKYFGKSGADLIPLLNQGRAGIEEMRMEAERLGIVITKEAAEAAEQFNDNLTRLKAAASGVAIELAGPLVKALGDATGEFIKARKEGEGFFTAMLRGWRELATGSDAQKWAKEFTDTTESYLQALNKMDAVRKGRRVEDLSASERAMFEREKQRAEDAKARLDTLRKIESVVAPEEKRRPDGGGGSLPMPVDESQAQRDRELFARQTQEAMDEEVRVRSEIAQLMADYRAAELERERTFQEQRNQILIDAYDREQDAAIAAGAELIAIDEETRDQKKRIQQQQLADAGNALGNLAGLMNTESRKTFEFGKAAAIAQAGFKTALAVVDAWEAGMSTGGPWAPAIAAAYAAAAMANGLNMINNIRSQSFGGGGGAPTPTGQGASGVAAQGDAAAGASAGGGSNQTTIIQFSGTTDERKLVRRFAEMLNENSRDGGRLILAGS